MKAIAILFGIPVVIGVTGALYLLSLDWLLKRLHFDPNWPWYPVTIVGSFVAILYVIAKYTP